MKPTFVFDLALAGAWVTGTAFINRQTDLVEAFADEMTYHIGDEREMGLCIKEYKGKLGPKLYREAMFKVTNHQAPSTLYQ